jgi:ComF family protein
VQSQWQAIKDIALNLLFPQRCVGCGKEGGLICPACHRNMPRIVPPVCPRCGKSQPNGVICSGCAGWQPNIDGIRSPFRFDGVIRQAVHQFKYQNLRTLAVPLSRFLQEYLTANPIPVEVLVPVPLHPRRLRERGYNQSAMLAENLGKLTDLPLVPDCLIRTRFSIPQARTENVEERKKNVAGVFTCRSRVLQNKRVLLIDDVATTGMTLDACARALKEGGAASVWGLVLAREV